MSEHGNELSRRSVLKHSALATGSVVLGSVAASGTAAAGIGDGRVGHYNLNNLHLNKDTDEKVKDFVHDASPAKNHGTNKGAEVVKDGKVGKAFEFDGTDYIAIDNDPSLVFGDGSDDSPFSVSAWVNIPEKRNAHVVSKGYETSSLEYLLNVDTDRKWAQFRMYDGGGGNTIRKRVEYENNVGEWHHVVGTYDGSGDPSGITVYVDSEVPNTVDKYESNYTAMSDEGDDVEIGAVLRGSDRFGGFFKGELDEVRIYDRALSDAEVTELYEMRD